MSIDRKKKIERRNKKKKKEAQKRKQLQNTRPEIKIMLRCDNDSISRDLRQTSPIAEELFWKALTPVETRGCKLLRYNDHELADRYKEILTRILCQVLTESLIKANPKYDDYRYSFGITHYHKMTFYVDIKILEKCSTEHGNVNILPNVFFPHNMRVGFTKHAIDRLRNRTFELFDVTVGQILRLPIIMIPYKEEIHAIYFGMPPTPGVKYDGQNAITYGMIGYSPVSIYDDLMICKTVLSPGFAKTPEYELGQEELRNHMALTVINGGIRRINFREHETFHKNYSTKPYKMMNPNAKILINIAKSLENIALHKML